MSSPISPDSLFDARIAFPDPDAKERLDRLVGLEQQISSLTKMLAVLVNPQGLSSWAKKYHKRANLPLSQILRRPPLVILGGDVGSGKTELAETIGDAVARQEKISITLFPLSLSTRGQGRVGEMTQLLSAAFSQVGDFAKKYKSSDGKAKGAAILLVDEADALAQSREANQMHHEDRAGVNAFIRGVDKLAAGGLPAAVIMCTNRLTALDPAVTRRAAEILSFNRPTAQQRKAVLAPPLLALGLSDNEVQSIVDVTGVVEGRDYGHSFSDLANRVLPRIILDAYPSSPVTGARALQVAQEIVPTKPFKDMS